MLATVLSATLAVTAIGCVAGAVDITTTWKAKDQGARSMGKTLVMGVTENPDVRRLFETRFVKELTAKGYDVTAASSVMPTGKKLSREELRAGLLEYGFASVLLTVVTDEHIEDDYVSGYALPTLHGRDYYGVYSYAWARSYTPGYTVTTERLTLETLLYDVESVELVWMGVSEVFQPDKMDDAIGQFSSKIAARLGQEVPS